jgi:hypothetical protein
MFVFTHVFSQQLPFKTPKPLSYCSIHKSLCLRYPRFMTWDTKVSLSFPILWGLGVLNGNCWLNTCVNTNIKIQVAYTLFKIFTDYVIFEVEIKREHDFRSWLSFDKSYTLYLVHNAFDKAFVLIAKFLLQY